MVKMSVLTDFHGLLGILYDIVLSFGHSAWKSRQVGQFLTISSVSIHIDPLDRLM